MAIVKLHTPAAASATPFQRSHSAIRVSYSRRIRGSGALPIYFADYWSRRAEFEPLAKVVRGFSAPSSAQDPVPYDIRDRLGEITVPTVVLVGEHDFICGPRWAGMMHERIKGSRLAVFENSGHFAHIEQPADFVKAVTGALLP